MKTDTYNPDVLNCLANLSNDEVFTPPSLANQVLDLLSQELFSSPTTTFLDPVSKSGVFLREIVKRLDRGLEAQMPDRRQRIELRLPEEVRRYCRRPDLPETLRVPVAARDFTYLTI